MYAVANVLLDVVEADICACVVLSKPIRPHLQEAFQEGALDDLMRWWQD